MARYFIQETYVYDITADNPEQAREFFTQWVEDPEGSGVYGDFKENFLDIYDEEGNQH